MKRLLVFLLFLWLGTSAFGQSRRVADNSDVSSNLALMEQWIQAQMTFRRLPGMSVALVYDQDLVYAKGFGYADLEKKSAATAQTIYRIASITKTFTATAIMQLRDRGKLRLDDPVEQYLPWFQPQNAFPDAPKIQIWHLLTHTSGLPREAAFPYWTDNKFPTRTELIRALEHQETVFPPEERFKYSNLAYAIAGEIVAETAGMPYSEFVTKNILDPLGMTSTSVYFPDVQASRLAVGYSRKLDDGSRNVMPFTNAKALVASANMSSTVEDLAKFISLQFRSKQIVFGDQILKSSTVKEMERVHWLNPDWKSGWGLGFSVWRQDNQTVVGHSGWVGGYRSQISFIPDIKIGVIVLTNSDDGDPAFFTEEILRMMTPSIQRATATSVEVSIPDPSWSKFVGSYQDAWWYDVDIMLMNGRLMMYNHSYPPEENPRGNLVELTPVKQNTFRMTGENGSGELVVFEMGDNGQVSRVKVGENFIFPKPPSGQ